MSEAKPRKVGSHLAVVLFFITVVVGFIGSILEDIERRNNWDVFKMLHDCHLIEKGRKHGNVYVCNDGVTYYGRR